MLYFFSLTNYKRKVLRKKYLFQTRDSCTAGGKLLARATVVQLPKELSVRPGAGRRAGGRGDQRPALARRALAVHRHGVCVSCGPSTSALDSSILSTDSDVFERFIYFSKRFMANCALVRTASRRSPALSPLGSIDS